MHTGMITYNLLDKYNEIAHFCTSRRGGVSVGNYASFNLSPFTGDDEFCFAENRQILCNQLGVDKEYLIIPFQTHGCEIREIDNTFFDLSTEEKQLYLHGVDAIVTQLPGVCIGVTTADCVPLLFFDPKKQIVAAVHAGWRGTCAGIAGKTISFMIEKYKSNPADILVAIGPSISADVYEVGEDVVDEFKAAGFDMSEIVEIRNNSIFLNLWQANKQLLEKAGVLTHHIEVSGICTYTDHENFFSARRLGINSGRLLSGIMIKKTE
ncbi:MAG: peptidoglycan editing factor PgeF [Paludibacter sp.]|nr:peptidoglycan editing factor PgeF [Paludibacter sp.]